MASFSSEKWQKIWSRKGEVKQSLLDMNGFTGQNIDHKQVAADIVNHVAWQEGDTILEVGCGAGSLGQYLPQPYTGIDYSSTLINHHIKILGHTCLVGNADDLPFKNDSFDHVIVFSVFQYFNSIDHAAKVCAELERVARKCVFIGDLRRRGRGYRTQGEDEIAVTDELTHQSYSPDQFKNWRYTIVEKILFQNNYMPFNAIKFQPQPVRVYCDMCADLFHVGHVNLLRTCKLLYPSVYLIVGLHDDETIVSYKRAPVCSLEERAAVVRNCQYVDEVVLAAPLTTDDEYLSKHNIDIVIHGDGISDEDRERFYGCAIKANKYREVPRYKGISTTDLIKRCLSGNH